ncbi:hypothetical protein [Paenibacillus abyssi]|uniref:Uncharacterized protein n=1 Tax=Paenibacillus abyssi TaxID=1340531 RepID=A0A917D515_9BACL|nr:hypothetical protein [Paenibacillus abyssi]GGG12170.1 hypothetical protein GCM10010916_31300 [Paenibacillus abyssi]
MYRKRSFVIGLGMGLILGALLLQLMITAKQQESDLMQAEQNSTGVTDKLYSQEEVDQMIAQERGRLAALEPEHADAEQAEKAAANEPDEKSLIRIVRITSGSNLNDTAQMLEDYGLIEDKYQFISSMRDRSRKIRSGTFYFEGMPSEEQVKETITQDPILSFPIE